MKSVCICGSFKHYNEMLELRGTLLANGASCEWPTPGPRTDPKAMSPAEARVAIVAHLERMDRADLILIFSEDGYTGNSVAMEIGYAYARGQPVYVLSPIPDLFLMGLVTAVVTAEQSIELLKRA